MNPFSFFFLFSVKIGAEIFNIYMCQFQCREQLLRVSDRRTNMKSFASDWIMDQSCQVYITIAMKRCLKLSKKHNHIRPERSRQRIYGTTFVIFNIMLCSYFYYFELIAQTTLYSDQGGYLSPFSLHSSSTNLQAKRSMTQPSYWLYQCLSVEHKICQS